MNQIFLPVSLALCTASPVLLQADAPPPSTTPGVIQIEEGPWGKLEYYEVTLQPPRTHLTPALFTEETRWPMPTSDRGEVLEILASCGFSEDAVARIDERGEFFIEDGVLILSPPDEVVAATTSDQRLLLLEQFAKADADFKSRRLTNIEGGDFHALAPDLPASTRSLVESVLFESGGTVSFFDRPFLVRQMPTREDKIRLVQALFRTNSLIVRLVVDPSTEIEAVSDYWSAGEKNRSVESILRGVRSTAGVERVDLVHLLPPLARKYLYTYPDISDINPMEAPDCFWCSLNFFNKEPSHRAFDSRELRHYLADDYDVVEPPYALGDIFVVYRKESRDFVHSWVHIAGDIVFTKNGRSIVRPYALSRRDQMLSVYRPGDRNFIEVYRRK